jgi:hypothetical protein
MLVACQLAGLSALGAHYAGVKWRNAGQTLAPNALVPWLGGPRSRGRSKRLLRSRWRVGRGRGVPPAPSGGARKKGTGG